MTRRARLAAACGCAAAMAACWTVSDAWRQGPPGDDGGSTSDDSGDSKAPADGGGDGTAHDGGGDAGTDGGVAYHDMTDPMLWQLFDVTTVNPAAMGFDGAVFDGRYLYLVPYQGGGGGLVVQYDTHGAQGQNGQTLDGFTIAQSYVTWDLTTVDSRLKGFWGGAFDGRYVYFVPYGSGGTSGVVARYDTTLTFGSAGSVVTVDLAATVSDPRAVGFSGAVFDPDAGTLYFVPYHQGSFLVRYHTAAPLDAGSSYETYPETAGASVFFGGAFDGRFLYYGPVGGQSDTILRYDTNGSLSSPGSYATFNPSSAKGSATNYQGTLFDGRYMYLVPGASGPTVSTQYDTQSAAGAGAFTNAEAGAYSFFDVSTLDGGGATQFTGGALDGKRVFFSPGVGGVVVSHDVTAPFDAPTSWARMDLTKLPSSLASSAHAFGGAAFDGRYVYFLPYKTGVLARFDARTPQGPWRPGSP
jgi:hypothetical protein